MVYLRSGFRNEPSTSLSASESDRVPAICSAPLACASGSRSLSRTSAAILSASARQDRGENRSGENSCSQGGRDGAESKERYRAPVFAKHGGKGRWQGEQATRVQQSSQLHRG